MFLFFSLIFLPNIFRNCAINSKFGIQYFACLFKTEFLVNEDQKSILKVLMSKDMIQTVYVPSAKSRQKEYLVIIVVISKIAFLAY